MSAQAGPGEVWVTHRAEERLLPDFLIPRYRGFSSCMVWSYTSLHAKGPLVFFEKEWCTNAKGTVESNVYVQHILPLVSALSGQLPSFLAYLPPTPLDPIYCYLQFIVYTLRSKDASC
jgi:hypothetical protein